MPPRVPPKSDLPDLLPSLSKVFNPYDTLTHGPITLSGVAREIREHLSYGGYKRCGLMPSPRA